MLIQGLSALTTAVVSTAGYGMFAPRSRFWGPVISSGDATDPSRTALTFDDGPHPDGTPEILDALAERGVKAAFFVIGANAERWPHLVKRIVDEGHLVANHSQDHHMFGICWLTGYWERQIARADEVIEGITGRRPKWFRPPMGFKQWHLHKAARNRGHAVITFSRRAYDGISTTPERIIARIVPHTRPGDIITLHDGTDPTHPRKLGATGAALRQVIDGVRARGINFVRLDELIVQPPYAEQRTAPEPKIAALQ